MIRRMNENTDNSRFFSYLKDIEQSTARLYDNYFRKNLDLDTLDKYEFYNRLADVTQQLEAILDDLDTED